MTLPMTDHEIKMSYLDAADKRGQLKVIAQLNGTTVPKILAKLRALGVEDLPEPQSRIDHELALALYSQNLRDSEIAAQLGCTQNAVRNWRLANDLPAVKRRGKPPKVLPMPEIEPEPEPPADPVESVLGRPPALSCGVLVEMLRFLPDDRVVLVDGSPVVRAEMRGGLTGPRLQLYTEKGLRDAAGKPAAGKGAMEHA